MIAPHLAVQSIMTALQMNDYPEEDAGARTAYLFSKPYDCENLIAGQVSKSQPFIVCSLEVSSHCYLQHAWHNIFLAFPSILPAFMLESGITISRQSSSLDN